LRRRGDPPLRHLLTEEEAMEINNVIMQSNQADALRPTTRSESSIDISGKGPSVQVGSQSSPATSDGQLVSISSNIDYIQNKLDAALMNDPPFFPAGHPQRIDLIKGIKGIQENIEKSAVPEDVKKGAAGPKLSDHASNSEISAAWDSLVHFKDSFIQRNAEGPTTKQTGTVVNIKI
jgi:hypothetical protein